MLLEEGGQRELTWQTSEMVFTPSGLTGRQRSERAGAKNLRAKHREHGSWRPNRQYAGGAHASQKDAHPSCKPSCHRLAVSRRKLPSDQDVRTDRHASAWFATEAKEDGVVPVE